MPEWNPQAKVLLLQAIEISSPEERRNFLEAHCAGDNTLRAEVESLLAASASAGNFLESPVVALESKLRPGLSATADLAATHERPGTLVGRYKLREQIGEGGMGTVWIAEQTEPLRRKVALKLVKAGMDTKEVLSRFEVERQALALMDHPNIAKVHDGGVTSTGRPFFVMEYVKGIPITQFCDDAKQTVQERLQLFVQVCQAVQHAHQKGIIHRDLKPSNILVCLYDGRPIPKIIDFGLAKAMHQPLTEKTLYTAHGLMVGTPLYMSPEQAEFNNLDVDTRTDIYSLGVILYELLTGTTPLERKQFKDAALQEILRLIKEEDPQKPSTKISGSGSLPHIAAQRSLDPTQLSRVVKGDLDWIAMKSLEKDRSRRYETASGLARDVQRYLDDEPVEACPPSLGYKLRKFARRNTRALATAALLGVVVLGALAVVAGSIGWVVRDRQARQAVVEREVLLALDEVQAAVDDYRDTDLSAARNALNRAEGHLTSHETRVDVRNRVQQWKTDLAMAALLREIQLDKSIDDDNTMAKDSTVAAYQQAFTSYNLDLDRLDNSQAIQRLRESSVKQHLLTALDDWALQQGTFDSSSQPRDRGHAGNRLLQLARDADSDPWRNEFRLAVGRNSILDLEKLAQQCDVVRQRPLTIALLGTRLRQVGLQISAQQLLSRALERYPSEFCLNQALGIALLFSDTWKSELSLHSCVNMRPTNAGIRTALGMAMFENGYVEEAEKELREAIRLRPTHAEPHVHLGELLKYVKNLAGAEAEFRQAMKLDPRRYAASENLKILLVEQQKLTEAAAAFQEAIDHSPQAAPAYFCLGDVLALLNKSDEAQALYKQAARLSPKIAEKRKFAELKNAPAMPAPSSERLEEVSQHYAAMVLKTPDSHGFAMQSAVLLLLLGKRSEYEALCRQMLERFGETEIAIAAHRTSLTCLLLSPPVGDQARLEQLAKRATAKGDTGKHAALLYGRGRGLAAYRAGRWEEAIKWCAESRSSGQGLNISESVETHDLVIEAMAYHQLGNAAESRRLYEEANRLIRGRYPGAPTSLGNAWFDWVVYQILRQEAAALLGISPVDESSVDVHIALAQMHLNQGHWAEGAHHLAIIIEARPQDHLLAMQTAVLQLYRRDQKGYERACQLMLKRYGDTQDPVEADRTAKACLLANPPVGELSQLVKLAGTAVSDPKSGYYRFFALVRALAAYRQGNWEESLTWCHNGQQRFGDPKQVPYLVAHYYVVQAMAQHRTGKLEGAKSSLLEAHKIISETYPGAPNNLADRWADWMIYDILRREAELLMQPASLKSAASLDQPVDP